MRGRERLAVKGDSGMDEKWVGGGGREGGRVKLGFRARWRRESLSGVGWFLSFEICQGAARGEE